MSSRLEGLSARLAQALGDRLQIARSAQGEITLTLAPEHLLAVALMLRDQDGLHFEQLIDLCGVDYSSYGDAALAPPSYGAPGDKVRHSGVHDASLEEVGEPVSMAGAPSLTVMAGPEGTPEPPVERDWLGGRFAVVYHLLSIALNQRVRLRVFAADDELPIVDSVIGVWPAANWFEREAFDLFGIVFKGHPDLRRLLTDYGFIGNPFRKDFPLSGHVEMRYDPDQQRVIYQPVTIEPRENTPRIVREKNYGDTSG